MYAIRSYYETIIGASVIIKGTAVGTVTNLNGEFNLSVPSGSKILVVSYVGMQSKEIPITSSVINVTLQEDTKVLEDIVVIA